MVKTIVPNITPVLNVTNPAIPITLKKTIMINDYLNFEKKINDTLGTEAIIQIIVKDHTNESYLPEDWDKPYFLKLMKFFLTELKEHYGLKKQLLKVDIIPIPEYLENAKPKEKAIEIVKTLRDSYIKEYLNN